jgi:ferrochelatase
MKRVAVVLFNLGGPDGPDAVRPFLFNLFNDKAIIGAPQPVRWAIATLISSTRERSAQANYAMMGGRSPLLPETEAQAAALGPSLIAELGAEVQVFIAMRYWRPFTADTARAVAAFQPDEVVLLPLYPQYSTTTSGSSIALWRKAYRGPGRVHEICCYPEDPGLTEAHARAIRATHRALGSPGPLRVLFSAHGLPQQVVDRGDPYQHQVERTVSGVVARLGPDWTENWDWRVCYQSRVGPLKWLEPSTTSALAEAGRDGRGVLVVPIAFVSEHVETLVELDHEYAEAARELGLPFYLRAPAVGTDIAFIDGLVQSVKGALDNRGLCPAGRPCDPGFARCPYRAAA